ncbi:hypothetical protein TYRP_012734 [Tyrophagus putrescentiae]|nr:hypothetical protein TYRP_012734 [Tyrophagus putrescentiae]
MARLAVAGCAAIGLYFLLVCLVTGHSSVLLSSKSLDTSTAPSSSSLRFHHPHQTEVDDDDQQSAVVVDDIRVLPDPPSRKQRKQQSRAKSASKVRGNPTDRHRYTLSDGGPSDDADENKDDDPKRSSPSSYSDCSYHLAFTLVEANGSGGGSGQGKRSKLLGKFRNCLSSVLRHLNSTGYESVRPVHSPDHLGW